MEKEYKPIPPEGVIKALSLTVLKDSSREIWVTCPFCGDARQKASFNKSKGFFKCFVCGESGNTYGIFKKLSGLEGKALGRKLNEIREDSDVQIDTSLPFEVVDPEDIIASPEICNKVYRFLMANLTLSKKHKEDLLRRGLTESEIEKFGFCSVPDVRTANHITELAEQLGLSFAHVPGFFKHNGRWTFNVGVKGYMCPVYDTMSSPNYVLGFQIRLEKPVGSTKYMWFASREKDSGTGSGAPACFLRGRLRDITIVTEGILKATVTYFLLGQAVNVIGVPGITTFRAGERYFPKLEGTFAAEAYDMEKVLTAEDKKLLNVAIQESIAQGQELNDFVKHHKEEYKPLLKALNVKKAAFALTSAMEGHGISVYPLKWDMDGKTWKGQYKGIDDQLLDCRNKEAFIAFLQEQKEAMKE